MKLNAIDMIAIPSLLPPKASLQDLLTARSIAEKVVFTAEDRSAIDYAETVTEGGRQYRFSKDKALELVRDVSFTVSELQFLKDRITDLDKTKALTVQLLDIALKIRNEPM